jgi:hypothetical protein
MEAQISAMETDFLRYASLARYQYNTRRGRQIASHTKQMSAWNSAIQNTKQDSDQRLAQEVAICIGLNAGLRREVEIQERVNAALRNCAIEMPEMSNTAISRKVTSYERQFEHARLEINSHIAHLEKENAVLGSTLETIKTDSEKLIALQSKLENYNELKQTLSLKETELTIALTEDHAKENELSERLGDIRAKRLGIGELLRSELASLCSRATTLNALHARRLKAQEIRVQRERKACESETRRLKRKQEKEIEECEKRHIDTIERMKTESRNVISDLEIEIAKTVALQDHDRTLLEAEVDALRQAPAVCEPSFAPAMPSARRKRGDRGQPQFSDLNAHIVNESTRLCNELAKGRTERDERVRIIREPLDLATEALENEKTQFLRELQLLEGQSNSLLSQTRERFQEPKIVALVENIASQQKTIKRLRDEIERSRVSVPKRRALYSLQQQSNQAVEPLRASIDELQIKGPEMVQQLIADCSQRLAEATLKNEVRVQDAMQRLEVVCNRRASLQMKMETAYIGNFHKWRELRTDLGMAAVPLDSSSVVLPPPTHMAWAGDHLVLPPLRVA